MGLAIIFITLMLIKPLILIIFGPAYPTNDMDFINIHFFHSLVFLGGASNFGLIVENLQFYGLMRSL